MGTRSQTHPTVELSQSKRTLAVNKSTQIIKMLTVDRAEKEGNKLIISVTAALDFGDLSLFLKFLAAAQNLARKRHSLE